MLLSSPLKKSLLLLSVGLLLLLGLLTAATVAVTTQHPRLLPIVTDALATRLAPAGSGLYGPYGVTCPTAGSQQTKVVPIEASPALVFTTFTVTVQYPGNCGIPTIVSASCPSSIGTFVHLTDVQTQCQSFAPSGLSPFATVTAEDDVSVTLLPISKNLIVRVSADQFGSLSVSQTVS